MKVGFVPFPRPRGQPLLIFALVLGGWLVLRVLLWESPFAGLPPARAISVSLPASKTAVRRTSAVAPAAAKPARFRRTGEPSTRRFAAARALARPARGAPPQSQLAATARENPATLTQDTAGCSTCRQDATVRNFQAARNRRQSADLSARHGSARWSGDAWLFVRKDSSAPLVAGRPTYGRSQAGAVLRYRLAPSSSHRPILYARASRALAGAREAEVAAGFAARPVPDLPVRVSAELRIHESAVGSEVRPAAFAVTELPSARLPLGLRGELYVQGGYVGGRFATGFVDGQARVDRQIIRIGDGAELRAGGAVSGGAQKHAERLDVGPSAVVSFRLGEAHSRLMLDYRFRVAGDAEPGDGPALTFSAGF